MAAAGLEQVLAWGVPGIAAALGERTRALDDALDANGLSTWKTPGHAPHLTALRPPAERLDAVFDTLARERIACTRRHGLLRIAPHLPVTPDDMPPGANGAAAATRLGKPNGTSERPREWRECVDRRKIAGN